MGRGRPAHVEVTATGEVRAVPDRLRLDLGLEVRARTPGQALRQLAERSQRLARVLDGGGVAPADRQTTAVHLHAVHEAGRPRSDAFEASSRITVRLGALDTAGAILDAAAAAVETSVVVGGISWSVDDRALPMRAARAAAIEAAMRRAEELAAGTGHRLGPILRVAEDADPGPRPPGRLRQRAMTAASGMAVEPGEETISVSVWCRFALLDPGPAADRATPAS